MRKDGGFIPIIILAIIVVILGIILITNNQTRPQQLLNIPQATVSYDPTTFWIDYSSPDSRFSFKHPNDWEIINNSPKHISLGINSYPNVEIFTKYNFNLSSLQYCPAEGGILPCLSDATQVTDILVGGRTAKDFYINTDARNKLHIVQVSYPKIEMDFYISDGLDRIYKEVLSTFKFTK